MTLHPAFYGSYDWHSSVHGHWMLVRLLRLFPDLNEAREARTVLGAHLTAENLSAEADYFARKESKPFERPYGWAWLLKLAQEVNGWNDIDAKAWANNLRPLADVIVARGISSSFRSRPTRSELACTRTRHSGSRSPTTTLARWATRGYSAGSRNARGPTLALTSTYRPGGSRAEPTSFRHA